MKMNDNKTMQAPIQYETLEVCEYSIIWPIKDSGMVRLSPTVVTRGDVKSIEYAQQISETKEVAELICKDYESVFLTVERRTHQHNRDNASCRGYFECLNTGKMENKEAWQEYDDVEKPNQSKE